MQSKLYDLTLPPLKRYKLYHQESVNHHQLHQKSPQKSTLPAKKRKLSRTPPSPPPVYSLPAKKRIWATPPFDLNLLPKDQIPVQTTSIKIQIPHQINHNNVVTDDTDQENDDINVNFDSVPEDVDDINVNVVTDIEYDDGNNVIVVTDQEAGDDNIDVVADVEEVVDDDDDVVDDEEDDDGVVCSVCQSTDGDSKDPIVFCDGCDLMVHCSCYGHPLIEGVPEGDWFCEQCLASNLPSSGVEVEKCCLCPVSELKKCCLCPVSEGGKRCLCSVSELKKCCLCPVTEGGKRCLCPVSEGKKCCVCPVSEGGKRCLCPVSEGKKCCLCPVSEGKKCCLCPVFETKKCCLCPVSGGAMKATIDGKWAHIVCALFIPEVFFEDPEGREGIDCSMVPGERFEGVCYLCDLKNGCVLDCSEPKCPLSFHVTCGVNEDLYVEYQQGKKKSDVVAGFCRKHTDLWQKQQQSGKYKIVARD